MAKQMQNPEVQEQVREAQALMSSPEFAQKVAKLKVCCSRNCKHHDHVIFMRARTWISSTAVPTVHSMPNIWCIITIYLRLGHRCFWQQIWFIAQCHHATIAPCYRACPAVHVCPRSARQYACKPIYIALHATAASTSFMYLLETGPAAGRQITPSSSSDHLSIACRPLPTKARHTFRLSTYSMSSMPRLSSTLSNTALHSSPQNDSSNTFCKQRSAGPWQGHYLSHKA